MSNVLCIIGDTVSNDISIKRHDRLDWGGVASTCSSEVAASATFGLFQFVKVHGLRSFAEQKSKLDSQNAAENLIM